VDEYIIVLTTFEKFSALSAAIERLELTPLYCALERIANTTHHLPESEAQQVVHILEQLNGLEYVQNVYHNLAITQKV